MPSFPEMIVILAIGLLLFGKRLPEVGKSLGKGIVEFKKGLKGIEDEIETSSSAPSRPPLQTRLPDQPTQPAGQPAGQPVAPQTAYRFDPYTGKPIEQASSTTTTTQV
jgi:sec-independent protein translocase protein TatA